MIHKAWSSIEEVPYCLSRSSIKFQGHTAKKKCRFWPKLGISGLWLQFEFTDGFEMMHNALCSIEEVLCYFSGSSIKFRGHTGWKIDDSNPIWVRLLGRSQLSNPSDLPCFAEIYPWGPVYNNSALVQAVAWCWTPTQNTLLNHWWKKPVSPSDIRSEWNEYSKTSNIRHTPTG